jgi:hypothetical protein
MANILEVTMPEQRWDLITPHLQDFQSHLATHIPQLCIQNATDRQWSDDRYKQQRTTGIFDQCGVYLLFDDKEALLYVGVAMNKFHDRIWSHDWWIERRFIDVIPFPREYCFFALALEYFLICRLHPPKNSMFQGHAIPTITSETTAAGPDHPD